MDCQTQIQNVLSNMNFSLPESNTWINNNNNNSKWYSEEIGHLSRGKPFSLFVRDQAMESAKLINTLLNIDNFTDFLMAAMYFRPKVNQIMFIYAFSSAVLHRQDCPGAGIPPLYEIFPEVVFDSKVLQNASQQLMERRKKTRHKRQAMGPIIVNGFTQGNSRDPESILAYFREDIGVTSHHWHWHLVYPHGWIPQPGGPAKDRKGEIFYFMHQQIMRRYDFERLSLDMPLTIPLTDWSRSIEEGYQPHLVSSLAGMEYAGRASGQRLQDVFHPEVGIITLDNLYTQRNRILQAIYQGFAVMPDGSQVFLDEETGMHTLGSMVESSQISPNRPFYGDLHNNGHQMISLLHDPGNRYNGPRGVMGFTETSPRDPVFYRWHKFVDMLFQEYKDTLPRYTDRHLSWPELFISQISVLTNGDNQPNRLYTFFETSNVEVSRGLDFQSETTSVQVRVRHLQNRKFKYFFKIINSRQTPVDATVRLFMAPKYNVNDQPFNEEELRMMFAEMDKFRVQLRPGQNVFNRASEDSSVTIAASRAWDVIQQSPQSFQRFNDLTNACGCGWPDHMLLPRGKPNGMAFVLFAMLTPYEEDRVPQTGRAACDDAASLCGIVNNPYPDRRPMGFPFDRRYRTNPRTRSFFNRTNMITQDIAIYHISRNAQG